MATSIHQHLHLHSSVLEGQEEGKPVMSSIKEWTIRKSIGCSLDITL